MSEANFHAEYVEWDRKIRRAEHITEMWRWPTALLVTGLVLWKTIGIGIGPAAICAVVVFGGYMYFVGDLIYEAVCRKVGVDPNKYASWADGY